jgi:putative membrane protein
MCNEAHPARRSGTKAYHLRLNNLRSNPRNRSPTMNRRSFLHTSAVAATALTFTSVLARAANGKVGKHDPAEWDKINKAAAEKVAAIKPTADPLSDADQKLMMEVAMGGMMQLTVSKLAVEKATDADVKLLAQAEVDEQTGLSAKLKEIATAKKVTLPADPDPKTQEMVTMLKGKTGAEFDRAYVEQSGVKGHQALNATMEKVESKAKDAALKALAAAALPLIKVHLAASRDEMSELGGGKKQG